MSYSYYYFGALELASWGGVNNSNKQRPKYRMKQYLIVRFPFSYVAIVIITWAQIRVKPHQKKSAGPNEGTAEGYVWWGEWDSNPRRR